MSYLNFMSRLCFVSLPIMLALLLIEDPPSVKRFAVPRCSGETILILQVPIDRTFRSADSDHNHATERGKRVSWYHRTGSPRNQRDSIHVLRLVKSNPPHVRDRDRVVRTPERNLGRAKDERVRLVRTGSTLVHGDPLVRTARILRQNFPQRLFRPHEAVVVARVEWSEAPVMYGSANRTVGMTSSCSTQLGTVNGT